MTCGRFVGTGIKSNNIHKELYPITSAPIQRCSKSVTRLHSINTELRRIQSGSADGYKMSAATKPTRYVRNCTSNVRKPMVLQPQLNEKRVSSIRCKENDNKPLYITFENNAKFRIPVDLQIHQEEEDSVPIEKKNTVSVSCIPIELVHVENII